MAQEGVDVEVLLVDDQSTDGSRQSLESLRSPLVKLLDGPGVGPSGARNRALPQVSTPWVAFLDDDDLWAPWKLRNLADLAGSAGFGFSSAIVTDDEGRPMRVDDAPDPKHLERQLLRRNVIGTPSVVVARAELVREVGGFDERLSVIGDWELWLRLAAAAPAFAATEPLTAYTVHTSSISVRETGALEGELRYLLEKHRDLFRQTGARVDMDWFMQWKAQSLIGRGQRLAAAGTLLHQAVRGRSSRSLLRAGRVLSGERLASRLRPPAPPPAWPAWLGRYYAVPGSV